MNETVGWHANPGTRAPFIEQVREDMKVIDSAGQEVGEVEYVQMGDPEAATTQGNELDEPGLIGRLGVALAGDEREPDIAEPKRSQLLRYGFIKIDGPGLMDTDRYVRSDRIASVAGDTVRLMVTKDQLPKEG